MRKLVAIAAVLLCSLPALAEIDLAVHSVSLTEAGAGLSDVAVVIDLRTHGPLSANTTDVTLVLDGVVHDRIYINYGLYVAPGCTYVPDYGGLGPVCANDPGCDLWFINGGGVPGYCALLIPGGVPLSCWCSHQWSALFTGVNLTSVSLLEVVLDAEQTCEEYWEDNNVVSIESPVSDTPVLWGTAKGLYR